MRLSYHVMSAPSPLGLLFIAASPQGLRYVKFMDRRSLKRTIAALAPENPGVTWEPSVLQLRPLADQLDDYFTGTRRSIEWPLDPQGTEFEKQVWRALHDIPFGQTRSYADIARGLGQPNGARAVGLASNRNPIAIVLPCHRVIGSDGKLVGYSGGVPRKKYLLALESRFRVLGGLDDNRVIAELHRVVVRPAAGTRKKAVTKKRATVTRAAVARKSISGSSRRATPAVAAATKATGPRRRS